MPVGSEVFSDAAGFQRCDMPDADAESPGDLVSGKANIQAIEHAQALVVGHSGQMRTIPAKHRSVVALVLDVLALRDLARLCTKFAHIHIQKIPFVAISSSAPSRGKMISPKSPTSCQCIR